MECLGIIPILQKDPRSEDHFFFGRGVVIFKKLPQLFWLFSSVIGCHWLNTYYIIIVVAIGCGCHWLPLVAIGCGCLYFLHCEFYSVLPLLNLCPVQKTLYFRGFTRFLGLLCTRLNFHPIYILKTKPSKIPTNTSL